MNKLDSLILEIISEWKNKPISKKNLIDKIQKKDSSFEVKEIFKSLRYLDQKSLISYNQMGKIKPGYVDGETIPDSQENGIVFINNYKDCFIKSQNSDEEYYVNKKNLCGAISGDLVSFVKTNKKSKKNITDVIITEVIEHNKTFFVGTISIVKDFIYCNLDNHKITQKIHIINPSRLVDGHKVWIKAIEFSSSVIKAEVVKIIGHKDDVGMDIISIVYGFDIEPEFDKDVEEFANQFSSKISDHERKRRVDLTNLEFVTIDPATSKDLDDSICVLKAENHFHLYVSIADVAHFVRPKNILDKCAQSRGTSIYLIDKVIPMLPHILSNDICSLNPDVERLALTCEMKINFNGEFEEIQVYDSIIKSKKKFSYDEVNNYFDKKISDSKIDSKIWKMLDNSYELFKILQNKLFQRGYIDFEIKEPKIILDDQNKVIDLITYDRGDAQILIENFMVAANEAVTIHFNKKFSNQPFVYRVHDKPNETKLSIFQIETKKIGFQTKDNFSKITSKLISDWVIQNNFIEPKKTILNKLLLKTMAKAEYSTKNIGHFGLASKNYTHFTSPIRRYPDILVHRLFKMFETDKESYDSKTIQETQNLLKDLAQLSSENEVKAVEIEREVNSLKFCEFMQSKIGFEFEGVVTHVSFNGIFVELSNLVEGMVRLSNIKINDFFIYDKDQHVLVGEKTKKRISFGTRVKIKVTNVNIQLRQIDFILLNFID